MQTPKVTKRFLPTLTEVVRPAASLPEQATDEDVVPDRTGSGMDEALVEAVLQRLLPELEQQVQAVLHQSLQSHWNSMLPHVVEDVKSSLRVLVSDAVAVAQDKDVT